MKNNLFKVLKVFLPFILLLVGIAVISLERGSKMDQGLSDEDKMLYHFINRQGKILGNKYQMRQSGNGLGGKDKVWLMSISFDRYGSPMNEKEARILLIQCVEDFLEAVNNDEQLKPFLKDYPFTAKNLDLTIINFDKDQVIDYFPNIAVVSNSRGKVGFFTEEPSNIYGYYTKKYETYDEAVAVLKEESEQ
jgi:hypothetical protein